MFLQAQIQAEEFATAFLAWLTKNVFSKKLEESGEKKRKVKLKIKGEKDVEESAEKAG